MKVLSYYKVKIKVVSIENCQLAIIIINFFKQNSLIDVKTGM